MNPLPLVETRESILKHHHDFGAKTTRLLEGILSAHTPTVFAVSAPTLKTHCPQGPTVETCSIIAEAIRTTVTVFPCIIRSSGLFEDGLTEANAGVFKSVIAHNESEIVGVLMQVLTDAYTKTHDLGLFSLLIQPYIKSHYGGVCFSRDPHGLLHTVCVHSVGGAESVVSGSSGTTTKVHRRHFDSLPFAWMKELCERVVQIEQESGHPQDIEWVYDGYKVWLLQARPITTLSSEQARAMDAFETTHFGDFYFDRSGPAETYPHPAPLTEDIVRKLYERGGPIHSVYTKLTVRADNYDAVELIDGQFYTNKERELKTFYPTHSYFGGARLIPHFSQWRGLTDTVRNTFALTRIPRAEPALLAAWSSALSGHEQSLRTSPSSFAQLLQNIVSAYETIFTINLVSLRAHAEMSSLRKSEWPHPSELALLTPESERHLFTAEHLTGNSLSIEDVTPFETRRAALVPQEQTLQWFGQRSTAERMLILRNATQLQQCIDFREHARFLSACIAESLRVFSRKQFPTLSSDLIPFLRLDELKNGTARPDELRMRKEQWERNAKALLPRILATLPPPELKTLVIAPGKATAPLVDLNYLSTNSSRTERKFILKTGNLDPGLIRYFPILAGIVADSGNELSHLAIMAREAGIPVIVAPETPGPFDGTHDLHLDTDSLL